MSTASEHEQNRSARAAVPATTMGPDPDGQLTPFRINDLGTKFMSSKYLLVANEVGLFAALDRPGMTAGELAQRCDLPARTTRTLVEALQVLGLLEPEGDGYRNAADVEAFLTGRGPLDMRPVLRHWERLSFPSWMGASQAFRTGKGSRKPMDEEDTEVYEAGVEVATGQAAAALPEAYDFTSHRRVLDVGGGAGTFLVDILTRNEHARGTLLELPEVVEQVREKLVAGPAGDRIDAVGADLFTDPIPEGYDALLVAHVVHLFPPERNLELLRRLRAVTAEGGRLLLADWWVDPDAPNPYLLLGSGEFLTISGGAVYWRDEVETWLRDTGWRLVDHRPVADPTSLLVAEPV